MIPSYAELHCVSNYSFLRGASDTEELVHRAAELGYRALAITDECSVAGVVRAHGAAKETGLKLVIGSEIAFADGPRVVLLAESLAGYEKLCELITTARRAAAKGEYRAMRADIPASTEGLVALWLPGPEPREEEGARIARRFHERAWIAIANGADAFVVGGTRKALIEVEQRARRDGAQVTPLRVGIPSHTPLLASAVPRFREKLSTTLTRAPAPPVVAGIDARLVTTVTDAIETLSTQLNHTIEWAQCIDVLCERGCRVFLEMPPGHALTRMVRERREDVEARGVEEFRDLSAVVRWVESRRDRA